MHRGGKEGKAEDKKRVGRNQEEKMKGKEKR